MTTRSSYALSVSLGLLMMLVLTSGCEYKGLNSQPLPFSEGGGDEDLRITVVLENSTNLVPNSEVRYNEVEVGSVRSIEFDDWTARLTVGIDKDARIPADVTARVAQKSLLGAEYLELASPFADTPAEASDGALLADGAVLDPKRTGRYPETEEFLSAAALMLNNGGLPQVRTIAHELNRALDGRTGHITSLVRRLAHFTGSLASQRTQIIGALESVDAFAQAMKGERSGIDRALDELPNGIEVLRRERRAMVRALQSVDDVAGIVHRFTTRTEDGLVSNLANLRPLTEQLSEHAAELAVAIEQVTFPFPIKAIDKAFFGDYINLFSTVDLNLAATAPHWTSGTPLQSIASLLVGLPPTASGVNDPLMPHQQPPADEGDSPGQRRDRGAGERDTSDDGLSGPGLAFDALIGGLVGSPR